VDDFIFVWRSREEGIEGMKFVRGVFERAGVLLNEEKCVLEPTQEIRYLGLNWRGDLCTVSVPVELQEKLRERLAVQSRVSVREAANVVGLAGVWRQVFDGAYAMLAPLTKRVRGLKKFGWDKLFYWGNCTNYLCELLSRTSRLWRREPVDVVWSDSSDFGAAGVDDRSGYAFGWSEEFLERSINWKETVALLGACIWKSEKSATFALQADSSVALARVRKGFCLADRLLNRLLLVWARRKQDMGLSVDYGWVPSEENLADGPSRGQLASWRTTGANFLQGTIGLRL